MKILTELSTTFVLTTIQKKLKMDKNMMSEQKANNNLKIRFEVDDFLKVIQEIMLYGKNMNTLQFNKPIAKPQE